MSYATRRSVPGWRIPAFVQGLGQTKGGTTGTSGKTGTSTQPDRTAQDWGEALRTGGSIVGSLIGGATGQQPAATPATETPVEPYAPPVPASPNWYWPVVIGVGIAVLGGIGYLSYSAKRPVKANAKRKKRSASRRAIGSWYHKFDAEAALKKHGGRGRIIRQRGPYVGSLDKYTVVLGAGK
jgi:hypothetical protein